MPPMDKPMTTLYLSGHSLGGAMAALMAVMLSVEPEYKALRADVQGRLHLRRTDGGLAGVRQRLRRERLPGPEHGPLRLQERPGATPAAERLRCIPALRTQVSLLSRVEGHLQRADHTDGRSP